MGGSVAFDLAAFAKPVTRAQALQSGALVDCSAVAAFQGFTVAAAISAGVWDEVVKAPNLAMATRKERGEAVHRLTQLWMDAKASVQTYRQRGVVLPSLAFTSRAGDGTKVPLRLVCTVEGGQAAVTIYLEGEA